MFSLFNVFYCFYFVRYLANLATIKYTYAHTYRVMSNQELLLYSTLYGISGFIEL